MATIPIALDAKLPQRCFMLRIGRREGPIKEFFRRYACIPSDLMAVHDIGNEILQIKLKIESIIETRDALGISNLDESRAESSASLDQRLQAWRQTYHHLDDDKVVVGFEDSAEFILKCILDPDVQRRCVISIVGMGGTGKTTLAAQVFNRNEVQTHFNTYAWFTVSQEYTVKDLLIKITRKVMAAVLHREDTERLQEMDGGELKLYLCDFLRQRKYLIVLDDIWTPDVWEQIKAAFPNEKNGSRVLITTRLNDVAKSADPTISPYQIPFLSQEQSWELFLRVVFPLHKEVISSCPKDLEELSRELVEWCGGLPLAVVVLGGLLSITEPTINAWLLVTENMDWESTDKGKICLQILALSYNCLPHHSLKSCFLYLGCFSEDYQYKASELIKLWIAEGFIPQKDNIKLEETAKDYVDELVKRCMVKVANKSDITGRVKTFQIHDLFHELCISEAKEDEFFKICSNKGDSTYHDIIASRQLVINKDISFISQFADRFHYSEYRARALLGFNELSYAIFLPHKSPRFNQLRVLHLSINSYNAPYRLYEKISRLIHLRYLCLSNEELRNLPSSVGQLCNLETSYFTGKLGNFQTSYLISRSLPSSIGKLCNLQTLDLRNTEVVNLPYTLCEVQSLQHLYLGWERESCETSIPIGRLRNLQTLKGIKAGSWIKREVASLSNIRRLRIVTVSSEHMTALSNSLHKLNHLVSLCLSANEPISAASLFSSLSRHQQLVKLTLSGSWSDICLIPQNLIKLSLEASELDRNMMAALEILPLLTILKLKGRLVQQMVWSTGAFPRLSKNQ